MNNILVKAKVLNFQCVNSLQMYIHVLEPAMPLEERKLLANGLLDMLCNWSVSKKPLPESVNEWLTLAPWKK